MIVLLMIVSMLLLIEFTSKWLIAQYREERSMLVQNLEQLLTESRELQVDSLIEIHITGELPPNADHPSLKMSNFKRVTVINARAGSGVNVRIDNRRTTTAATELISPSTLFSEDLKKGLTRYVMRLNSGANTISIIDSQRLLQTFQKKTQAAFALPVFPSSKNHANNSLLIGGDYEVGNSKSYLLKKISPQLGFSLLLLCLCSGAFTLAYITIRRQTRLNTEKDLFISNMSHELKTPVATAKVALEALNKFDALSDPIKTKDYLSIAEWEIQRLENLVNKVMSNVLLADGKMAMQSSDVDLTTLLFEIITHMKPIAVRKQKTIDFRSSVKELPFSGDPTHLQGMFYNVLDNAVKYGGANISVSIDQKGNEISIEIADNGPGVPPAYARQIFERFFRVPTGDVHDVKGYGLGLNYARYVARAHGGDIVYKNGAQGGANFTVLLQSNLNYE